MCHLVNSLMNNLLGLENEIIETDDIDDEDSPPRYELPVVPEGHVMDEKLLDKFLLAMIDMILRNY